MSLGMKDTASRGTVSRGGGLKVLLQACADEAGSFRL